MHNFFSWAQAQPERVVLTQADTGRRYTAGEIAQGAEQMAQWLAQQGLQAEETIAVLLENRYEIMQLVLAARLAGLYAAVISTHLTAAEVAYIAQDSGAKMLLVSSKTWPTAQEAVQGLALACYSVDGDTLGVPPLADALAAVPLGAEIDLSTRPLGRDLLYSSGTTGRPKGIKKPLLAAAYRTQRDPEVAAWMRSMRFDEDAVYLSPAPLYHAAPLRYSLRTLDVGGSAIIMSRFDPEQALALIERYQVTHSQWVPTMLGRLLKLPDEVKRRYRLDSHRVAIHAAAPCPVAVKQGVLDWWGDILLEYYAGSEGCGTTLIDSAQWRARPGSVGRAISGQLHIVGDDGQELGVGEVGRVYFSGGGAFQYLNDERKTREAIDARGWATYGDIGHVDAEGFLFLSDRRADLILSGGVNLYPQEIENALAQHAAVEEVAVVGVPDEDFGEQTLAVVVLKPGFAPDEAMARAIVEQAAGSLSKVKRPQRLVFEPSLPRLETGKLLRRVLKDRFKEAPQAGFGLRSSSGAQG
ncbi:MAG: AMP-binding protein [Comamonas sp.]|nr:AMP-binding protein [Comamonas sp.]